VRTFRLLLWLRWRLAMNATTGKSRWAMAALTTLLALAFAPLYVGAAIFSFTGGSNHGTGALTLVFGLAQLCILWVSLLAGALGRSFELDKLKRYPFRPFEVYGFNLLASFTEPVILMTLPSLVGVSLGVARHDGWLAGLTAAAGALLLLLITASALQLLLAILDDFLRREWMRYVAAFLFTGTFLAIQLGVRSSSRRLADQARQAGFDPAKLLKDIGVMFEHLPSVGAPAAVGGAPVSGPFGEPVLAFAASAVLVLVPLWLGARVMARAVTRETLAGRVRPRTARATRGSFGLRWPGLTAPQRLLLAREWLYAQRTPALLYQAAIVPLSVVFVSVLGGARETGFDTILPMFIMTGTLASRNLALWSYDGPGIRTLFLMPFTPRDLVLSKNLSWLTSTFAEAGFTFAVLTALRPGRFLPMLPVLVTGFAAVTFTAAAVGTWVSIAHPMKFQERGFTRRSPGGVTGLLAYLVVLVVGAGVVLAVMAARSLTPDAHDGVMSFAVTSLLLAASAAIWWLAMDRHADELERKRERMIDVLAKTADA